MSCTRVERGLQFYGYSMLVLWPYCYVGRVLKSLGFTKRVLWSSFRYPHIAVQLVMQSNIQ